jgi:hypothetical protein
MKDELSEGRVLKAFLSLLFNMTCLMKGKKSVWSKSYDVATFSDGSAEETNALCDSLVVFSKYLVDNFLLLGSTLNARHLISLVKVLAVKPSQPTPALVEIGEFPRCCPRDRVLKRHLMRINYMMRL